MRRAPFRSPSLAFTPAGLWRAHDSRRRPGSGAGPLSVSALEAHRDAHAAADAEGCETLLGVAAPHLVQERDEHARAGRADRVADRDGAAVHVHDRRVPAHVLVDRKRLRGERLVGLDELEILNLPASLFEGLA